MVNNKGLKSGSIGMFFCQSDIEKNIKDKDDKSTAYIIHQNNAIQTRYHDILNEFNELKAEKDILEEDNDKLQKAKTCLQGHVKNEFIRANNYRIIIENKNNVISNIFKLLFVCNMTSMLYMIIQLVPIYKLLFLFTSVTIHMTFIYNGVIHLRTIVNDGDIKKLTIENTEIEKSNKYLDELVDNF